LAAEEMLRNSEEMLWQGGEASEKADKGGAQTSSAQPTMHEGETTAGKEEGKTSGGRLSLIAPMPSWTLGTIELGRLDHLTPSYFDDARAEADRRQGHAEESPTGRTNHASSDDEIKEEVKEAGKERAGRKGPAWEIVRRRPSRPNVAQR